MAQIGLMIEGQWGLTWSRWQKLLQAAEELGFQCVFRSDHYTIGPPDDDSLETFVSLTYAASHTRRIEFGTLVAPTTFRPPVLTARMAAQIDDLSGGRMVLGLGTGWHEREHQQFGIPFHDFSTRFAMLEEALELTSRLYHSPDPVTYEGRHYQLHQAVLMPRPQRRPPLLIGGNGMKKTLPLAARFADEWNAVGISAAEVRVRNQRLDELLGEVGRPPEAVKRSLMNKVIYGRDEAEVERKQAHFLATSRDKFENPIFIGTGAALVDQLGAYVDAGIQRFMLRWDEFDDRDGLAQMAQAVLPHFHR